MLAAATSHYYVHYDLPPNPTPTHSGQDACVGISSGKHLILQALGWLGGGSTKCLTQAV